jgi:hypothetical protein
VFPQLEAVEEPKLERKKSADPRHTCEALVLAFRIYQDNGFRAPVSSVSGPKVGVGTFLVYARLWNNVARWGAQNAAVPVAAQFSN